MMPRIAEMKYDDRIRDREKKRRRRREYSDDEDEGTGISGWKLGMVIGVIVVCFAMLYPTLFHPILMGLMGRSNNQPKPSINQQRPPLHPAMGGGGHRTGGHPSRPDIHPAMRMAQTQAEGNSGGKGMFTWLLPVYTVGVVVFLLYMLFKKKNRRKRRKRQYSDDSFTENDDYDEDEEVNTKYGGKFGKKKLKGLQERLRQTEEAMSKILEQLEAVQAGAQPVDLDAAQRKSEIETETAQDESKKVEIGLSDVNEQYISDLEKALKEFQTLSKEYDNAKLRQLGKNSSEEELNSESEEEESDESQYSEESCDEKTNSKENQSDEEELIDVDSIIQSVTKKPEIVRRRKPKKT